jgi:hypothetical protein
MLPGITSLRYKISDVIEIGLVLALLAGTVGVAALLSAPEWDLLFGGGLSLVVLGMLIGVPAGLYYHVLLYRTLAPRGALGRAWWLHPTGLHARLGAADRPRVMRWFGVGAVGFVLAIGGCVLVFVGALRSR